MKEERLPQHFHSWICGRRAFRVADDDSKIWYFQNECPTGILTPPTPAKMLTCSLEKTNPTNGKFPFLTYLSQSPSNPTHPKPPSTFFHHCPTTALSHPIITASNRHPTLLTAQTTLSLIPRTLKSSRYARATSSRRAIVCSLVFLCFLVLSWGGDRDGDVLAAVPRPQNTLAKNPPSQPTFVSVNLVKPSSEGGGLGDEASRVVLLARRIWDCARVMEGEEKSGES